MLHQPERKEKNCLNCGTTVIGRYCHACGYENILIKESFRLLVTHFVYGIFHFDGRVHPALKYIFISPGMAARQYCKVREPAISIPSGGWIKTLAKFLFLNFIGLFFYDGFV